MLRRPPLQPTALTLLSRDPAGETDATWTLAAEFAGGGAAVTRQVKEATEHAVRLGGEAEALEGDNAAAFWGTVRDFGRAPETPHLIVRAMTLPSRLGDMLDALAETTAMAGLPPASVIAHAANGILYAYWDNPQGQSWSGLLAGMRTRIAHFRGTVVVEQAHAELVEVYDPWGPPPESFPIMQGFKREFDPHFVLNPGRFVGGL
jgi:FAD/FMN-containing dehydrogenase